jgi:hypothetical protein
MSQGYIIYIHARQFFWVGCVFIDTLDSGGFYKESFLSAETTHSVA